MKYILSLVFLIFILVLGGWALFIRKPKIEISNRVNKINVLTTDGDTAEIYTGIGTTMQITIKRKK